MQRSLASHSSFIQAWDWYCLFTIYEHWLSCLPCYKEGIRVRASNARDRCNCNCNCNCIFIQRHLVIQRCSRPESVLLSLTNEIVFRLSEYAKRESWGAQDVSSYRGERGPHRPGFRI